MTAVSDAYDDDSIDEGPQPRLHAAGPEDTTELVGDTVDNAVVLPLQATTAPTSNSASAADDPADNDGVEAAERDRRVVPSPGNPTGVAEEVIAEAMVDPDGELTVRWWRGDPYRWSGTMWQQQPVAKVRSQLYRALRHAWYESRGEVVPWNPTQAKINNLLDALHAALYLDQTVDPPHWTDLDSPVGEVISVANGNLLVADRQLLPHSPRLFNLHALPYDYDPAAPAPSRWLEFLEKVWPGDEQAKALLQEWFGYVLSGATDQHKILQLVGPPRSGKGTIARVLTAVIGSGGVAAPTLAAVGTQFGLQPLIGKTLAVIGDVRMGEKTSIVTERLLSISGEDAITVDRKYKEAWTGRLGVRFMLLSNELPQLGDASGALASRFAILQLTESWLGKEDRGLYDRLVAELPGILNWGLDGLDRLRRQGRFTIPASSAEAMAMLEELNSPILQFLQDECEIGAHYDVEIKTLHSRWRQWNWQQGTQRVSSVEVFGRDLRAALPGVAIIRPRVGSARVRVYRGVRLRPPAAPGEFQAR